MARFRVRLKNPQQVKFELGDVSIAMKDLGAIEIKKILTKYINQVNKYLMRQNGKQFNVGSPYSPAREDKSRFLKKRGGGLLQTLSNARYVTYNESSRFGEAGYDISLLGPLSIHEGSLSPAPVVIKPKRKKFITIPLKAALNADGTVKKFSDRYYAKNSRGQGYGEFFIDSYKNLKKGNWTGKKLAMSNKIYGNPLIIYREVGRLNIPYFILAKKVTIKKRLFVKAALERFDGDLLNMVLDEVTRYEDGITKKSRRR